MAILFPRAGVGRLLQLPQELKVRKMNFTGKRKGGSKTIEINRPESKPNLLAPITVGFGV